MPVPFDVKRLPEMIGLLGELQGASIQQYLAGLELRLRTLLADPRISPIVAPDNETSFQDWLHQIFGAGEGGKGQITIIDLSLVPSDVRTTIVAVLGRIAFEAAQRFRRLHNALVPLVIVLEEAHNFLQRQSADLVDNGSAVRCRHAFEKIAKEGRKFGVGLVVSSQRPAELSPTTIAQCNSFVLHRIVNDRDQELVSRLAPDTSGSLLKELPSLPTQQAILMGLASEIPLVFDVRLLPEAHRPNSDNPRFWDAWTRTRPVPPNLSGLAVSWVGEQAANAPQ
jgi:DNA helicase HerA-like ATPase